MTRRVTGECLCCGVVVSGPQGTVALPNPYFKGTDPFGGGQRVKCVAVQRDGRGSMHDVPLKWPAGVERLTDQATIVEDY